MGTGFGRGENRAVEAAQEAISSPLLDNISIRGAAGVLINITGGMELGMDEVTTISSIIQEDAGDDDAEIIFGAVHDANLKEEVRVTVIATGFERDELPTAPAAKVARAEVKPIRSAPQSTSPTRPGPRPDKPGSSGTIRPGTRRPTERKMPSDLEIPTFIRRQMD